MLQDNSEPPSSNLCTFFFRRASNWLSLILSKLVPSRQLGNLGLQSWNLGTLFCVELPIGWFWYFSSGKLAPCASKSEYERCANSSNGVFLLQISMLDVQIVLYSVLVIFCTLKQNLFGYLFYIFNTCLSVCAAPISTGCKNTRSDRWRGGWLPCFRVPSVSSGVLLPWLSSAGRGNAPSRK